MSANKTPYFSIVIPSYNRAKMIRETIGSVQCQTFSDWECIIVDDGSTDNTRDIVEHFSQVDNRIKYVYQENAERSAARNNGIRNSTGEYICFLDSDDHFLPDHLYTLKTFLEGCFFKRNMTIFQSLNITSNGEIVSQVQKPSSNIIDFLYTNPTTPSRVCVSREILNEIHFDEDIVIVEDTVLWMKIGYKYPVYISNHIGVKYFLHEDNSVNKKGTGAIKMYSGIMLAKKRYPEIFNKMTTSVFKGWTSRIMTNIAYHHILNDRKYEAIKWLIKAMFLKPFHEQSKMRIRMIVDLLTCRRIYI